MLSKSFIAFIFLLASISSSNAHAGVTPALGVKGQLTRNDVQRPSTKSPCGNVNIAQTLDSSTPVQADASGNFSPSITDFNPGADGSRSIKEVQVDTSGTGKNFVPAKMVVNGNANPTTDATEKLTVQLPPGTKCAGGAGKNLCLASFTTTAGFGNCVVVSQGAGAAKAPAARSIPDQSNVVRNGAAKGVIRSTDSRAAVDDQKRQPAKAKDEKKKKGKGKKNGKKGDKAQKKKDNKKGNKKNGKPANKGAPETPAATGNNRKRTWSSRNSS